MCIACRLCAAIKERSRALQASFSWAFAVFQSSSLRLSLYSRSKAKTKMGKKAFFYAVARGRKTGVFTSWDECQPHVNGFKGAIHQKFKTEEEAKKFLETPTYGPTAQKPQDNPVMTNIKRDFSTFVQNRAFLSNVAITRQVLRDCVVKTDLSLFSTSINDTDERGLIMDPDGFVVVHTDGSCENNGAPSGAKAGIGVVWNHGHEWNVSEPAEGDKATNNVGEIQAVTRAVRQATCHRITRLNIHTDSMFVIQCVTQWIPNWRTNGWRKSNNKDVINKKDLILLDEAIRDGGVQVKFTHVRGHTGDPFNEAADRLAAEGAKRYQLSDSVP